MHQAAAMSFPRRPAPSPALDKPERTEVFTKSPPQFRLLQSERHIVDGKAFIFRERYGGEELCRAETFAQLVAFIKYTEKPGSIRFHVENGHFAEWLGNHIETIGPAIGNGDGALAPAEKLAKRFECAKEHFNAFEWVNNEQIRSWVLAVVEPHLSPDEKREAAALAYAHALSKNGKAGLKKEEQDALNKKHFGDSNADPSIWLG